MNLLLTNPSTCRSLGLVDEPIFMSLKANKGGDPGNHENFQYKHNVKYFLMKYGIQTRPNCTGWPVLTVSNSSQLTLALVQL